MEEQNETRDEKHFLSYFYPCKEFAEKGHLCTLSGKVLIKEKNRNK